ncbi:ligand-binding sensor domain-containing protein [Sedimenticola sp.]|uniref:ligand-binding sensor domain-containing protein n=1 Tax=Sedimenticola sp. TaxID=1940285 RepID=UPI003D0DDBC4
MKKLLILLALLLAACDDTPPPEAAKPATATAEVGISVAKPAVLDLFNVGDSVYVRALAIEPGTNALWVGTSVGVHEVDLDTLQIRQTLTRKDGLANEYVFAIGIDKQGNKWFGTNGGGASRYRDGEWQTFFPMHGLADYWVYSFTSQDDGTLWIGTWAGANRVNPLTGQFSTYVKELINEWVYGLAVDSRDRVWFGTEGGVSRFDGKQWVSWSHADGLGGGNGSHLSPSRNTGLGTRSRHDLGVLSGGQATYNPSYVFSIHVARDDQVWAGTWGGGVSRFDGEKWQNLTTHDGLAGDIVYNVMQDSKGIFWFGTNGGVSRYDGKNWQTIGLAEGLPDSNVYALVESPSGDIWAGTRAAVVRIGIQPSKSKE